jgi:phosphoadenosine phosphosulfate reductase
MRVQTSLGDILINTLFETYRSSSLASKVDEALDFIWWNRQREPYFVGFSCGKDSIVTKHLVERSGVPALFYYSCTLIDPPEIYNFIRRHYPDVIWLYPKMTFWEGIKKKGLPTMFHRWCCDSQKKASLKCIPLQHRIMGVRKQESSKRAKRGRVWYAERSKLWLYNPIFNWNTEEVWEYIHTYKLPYPSMYNEGFSRIGCILCPFLTPKNVEKSRKRWPYFWAKIDKLIELSWLNIQLKLENGQKFKPMRLNFEQYSQWPNWPRDIITEEDLLLYDFYSSIDGPESFD